MKTCQLIISANQQMEVVSLEKDSWFMFHFTRFADHLAIGDGVMGSEVEAEAEPEPSCQSPRSNFSRERRFSSHLS